MRITFFKVAACLLLFATACQKSTKKNFYYIPDKNDFGVKIYDQSFIVYDSFIKKKVTYEIPKEWSGDFCNYKTFKKIGVSKFIDIDTINKYHVIKERLDLFYLDTTKLHKLFVLEESDNKLSAFEIVQDDHDIPCE